MRFIAAFLSSAALLATAGCSVQLDNATAGEKGNLRFDYSSSNCGLGCSLEQNALQGSKVSISTRGGDAEAVLVARLAGPDVGTISRQNQSCSCRSESRSRSVEPNDKCTSSETRSCSLSLDIETTQAGDAKLEIVDASGALVDAVTVHVRPAARIDVEVQNRKPAADGIYDVGRGEKVKVESHVLDADGNEMVFTQHGVSQEYGDKSIVGPDESVLIGSTEVEDAVARKTGETSLTLRATGAESVVRFRVK